MNWLLSILDKIMITHVKLIILGRGYSSTLWKRLNDFYSFVELGFRVLDFRHDGEDEGLPLSESIRSGSDFPFLGH